jgi:GPI mannosyltransferase 3
MPVPLPSMRPADLPPPAAPQPHLRPGLQRLALAAAALLPALVAVGQLGRLHPDEVYQFLEPAWFRAHGYGVLAWEWKEGLRNWALPLLASWLLRLAALLGLDHPVAYRALLALPQAGLHAAALLAVHRYARRRVDAPTALLSTALVALYAPVVVFAGRTLGESFSAAFLVLALVALEGEGGRLRAAGLAGGAWLGLAVVARYSSAVFVLAALLWLTAARRWRTLGFALLGGGAVALALGALDAWSWGQPFHSLLAYLRFNVLSDGAVQQFGAQPLDFYLGPLRVALPPWVLLALPAALRARRLPLPVFAALAYLVALFATPHKEDRFLYPALVLLALAAAPAASRALARAAVWLGRGRREGLALGLLAALALGAGLLPLRAYPALDPRGDQFRALVQASRGGATGLLIVNEGLWGAGGYFYLGRNLPWTTCDWPQDAAFQHAVRHPAFNRAITFEGRALAELQAAGFRVVGQVGRETLLAR